MKNVPSETPCQEFKTEVEKKMQFNLDEMLDNFDSPPSIIDVSSESREEFMVEPGDVQALDERFRVGGPTTDAMSAFVGAAAGTLFPSSSVPYQTEEVIDTGYSPQMSNFNAMGDGMREIQPISFGTGNNFHQDRPVAVNPNVPLISVPQQHNVIPTDDPNSTKCTQLYG